MLHPGNEQPFPLLNEVLFQPICCAFHFSMLLHQGFQLNCLKAPIHETIWLPEQLLVHFRERSEGDLTFEPLQGSPQMYPFHKSCQIHKESICIPREHVLQILFRLLCLNHSALIQQDYILY